MKLANYNVHSAHSTQHVKYRSDHKNQAKTDEGTPLLVTISQKPLKIETSNQRYNKE